MYNLGVCYMSGIGVKKDLKKGIKLYERAAEKGITSAMYNLASCYINGVGVKKDPQKGMELLERAAELGDGGAKEVLESLKRMTEEDSYVGEEI